MKQICKCGHEEFIHDDLWKGCPNCKCRKFEAQEDSPNMDIQRELKKVKDLRKKIKKLKDGN